MLAIKDQDKKMKRLKMAIFMIVSGCGSFVRKIPDRNKRLFISGSQWRYSSVFGLQL